MKKIYKTFPFEVKTTGDFKNGKLKLVNAEVTGAVRLEDGDFTVGGDVIDQITKNANKAYLVSEIVFNHLASLGYKNICMWDNTKTEYGGNTIQGGVIFA